MSKTWLDVLVDMRATSFLPLFYFFLQCQHLHHFTDGLSFSLLGFSSSLYCFMFALNTSFTTIAPPTIQSTHPQITIRWLRLILKCLANFYSMLFLSGCHTHFTPQTNYKNKNAKTKRKTVITFSVDILHLTFGVFPRIFL